jgi:hypothetical protein
MPLWGVTASALPQLIPGGVMTLTVNDAYYVPAYSQVSWPIAANTPVYAQVDSVDHLTTFGAVLELDEILGQPYNNIAGPILSAAGLVGPARPSSGARWPGEGAALPQR